MAPVIQQWKLLLQDIGVPAVVAVCDNCHAVVSIPDTNNLFMDIALEIAACVFLIGLIAWSINTFGSWWPGLLIGLILYIGRLYIKTTGPLEYIR